MTRGAGGFANHTKFEVGDGSKIRLWHDLWCGNLTLKEAFIDWYYLRKGYLRLTWNFLVVLSSGT